MLQVRGEMRFDLQPGIDGLCALKSDLEAYYWDQPVHGSQRYQISYWIRQVADRAAALESIVFHKGTSRLRFHDLTDDERATLPAALAMLDQWVHENDSFERARALVATALAAADRLGLHAVGGSPEISLVPLELRT